MKLFRIVAELGPDRNAVETIEAPNVQAAVHLFKNKYRWAGTPQVREITPEYLEREKMAKQEAKINAVKNQLNAVDTQLLVLNKKREDLLATLNLLQPPKKEEPKKEEPKGDGEEGTDDDETKEFTPPEE